MTMRSGHAAAVRAVQQFLGEGAWDGDCILERLQFVAGDLGGADTGDPVPNPLAGLRVFSRLADGS